MSRKTDKLRAYERWIESWSDDLYRFAYRLTGRSDLAEDLVQETYYHAWRSYASLRDHGSARAWLFQILRHRYSHFVRAEVRHVRRSAPVEACGECADERSRDQLADLALSESLRIALDALDERYKLPLLMVFLEGVTCKEASEQLGVPLGTVLSRIHRARQFLRERLNREDAAAETPFEQRLRLSG